MDSHPTCVAFDVSSLTALVFTSAKGHSEIICHSLRMTNTLLDSVLFVKLFVLLSLSFKSPFDPRSKYSGTYQAQAYWDNDPW